MQVCWKHQWYGLAAGACPGCHPRPDVTMPTGVYDPGDVYADEPLPPHTTGIREERIEKGGTP
jgi:hypothetical protein